MLVQVVMSQYQCLWITQFQVFYQGKQGFLLFLCTGVSWISLRVQTSLVAYSYRMLVVLFAVAARLLFGSSVLYAAISPHHIMITYSLPPQRPMPSVYLPGGGILPGLYTRAMNDDKRDLSHMHEVTPKEVTMAVSTVITMLRILFQRFLLFMILFLSFLFGRNPLCRVPAVVGYC